jgi:5-methylcytosine-specific restriction endonuclease McrA
VQNSLKQSEMWLKLIILDYLMHLYIKFTHKRIDYQLYLKTSHWKKIRCKAIKRADYKCQICSNRHEELHVHHNTYYDSKGNSILFWEKPSDLICVCEKCHSVIHSYIYVPKSKRKAS